MKINQKNFALIKMSGISVCLCILFFFEFFIVGDPLPSWNEGPLKERLIKFVKETTQKESPDFITPEERVATFDEDGTLWVEQPIYTQLFFAIDRIKSLASQHPEWQNEEPFKSILAGDHEKMRHLALQDIEQIIAVTHAGMSVEVFQEEVSKWLENAIHPRFKRKFTELVYQPMIEVIQFLRDNQFDIYIVSGGGQEFIRAFADKVYKIPPNHVIGTSSKVKYTYQKGQPILLKLSQILFVDNEGGKPEGINLIIGKRPIAAFGNSTGDQQMLEWTQAGKKKNFELLIYHDDAEREYAYGADSKVGTFSEALREEATKRGWNIASMKNDWKVIFSWQQPIQKK